MPFGQATSALNTQYEKGRYQVTASRKRLEHRDPLNSA
jgi:hypothetical protein